MLTLTYLSLSLFIIYITYIVILFGVPSSLSDSYYLLENKQTQSGRYFILFMFAISFLLLFPMIEITPEPYKFLAFIHTAAIAFVGAAPMFKEYHTKTVHYFSAGLAALISIIWASFVCEEVLYVYTTWAVIASILMIYTKSVDAFVFWVEMVLFVSIYSILTKMISLIP